METFITYIFAPILTALLSWIGWLIKKEIDAKEAQKRRNEELNISINKVSDYLEVVMETLADITETTKVSLQCHDVEFLSLHNSGIMNGESVAQRKQIATEIDRLDESVARIRAYLDKYRAGDSNESPKED